MQIKRQIRVLLALLATTTSFTSVQAMEKEDALAAVDKVYEATINSFYSINSFYNFSAHQADQEQKQQIQHTTGTVEDLVIDISSALGGSDLEGALSPVRDAWSKYEKSLNNNVRVVTRTGYTDLRLVGDLAANNIAFNDTLESIYSSLNESLGADVNQNTLELHKIGKAIALMMTKYSARSTSSVSQVYARENTDVTLDALAKDFTRDLDRLIAKTKSEEALKLLDSAKTKWEFIEPSIVNYNENRVNFIVNLYSRKIIEDLQEVSQI